MASDDTHGRPGLGRNARALWTMTALVLWLAIVASHRLGQWVHRAVMPLASQGQDPGAAPGHLWFGIAAVLLTVGLVIALCLWLRLGLLWLLFTVVLASFLYVLIALFPAPIGAILFLIVPPITGALFFPPKRPAA